MPVPKRRPAITPAQAAVNDRVRRARMANPPRDPTGEHHEAVAAIAEECGRDVVELLDTWDERAACREYDGCASRAEAERLAVDDVRAIFVRQAVLL